MIYIDVGYLNKLEITDMTNKVGIKKLSHVDASKLKELINLLSCKENNLLDKESILISTLISFFTKCDNRIKVAKNVHIERVYEYINENFLEVFSLDDLQKQFGINKYQLIQLFKIEYNTTPSAYQLQLKVAYSKLLLKKKMDLALLAVEAGFYDQAHFTREFKKSYGITPRNYQSNLF